MTLPCEIAQSRSAGARVLAIVHAPSFQRAGRPASLLRFSEAVRSGSPSTASPGIRKNVGTPKWRAERTDCLWSRAPWDPPPGRAIGSIGTAGLSGANRPDDMDLRYRECGASWL